MRVIAVMVPGALVAVVTLSCEADITSKGPTYDANGDFAPATQ